ncbi:MAG TPA: hypothetical protein VM238_22905 [Phycisphaerae bacterium]|nr:hypothetical protein [Phycisphaerae bacterium]
MAQLPNVHKFEATIPDSMWDEYERWAMGRDVSNRHLLKALFRLFLSAPDWLKLLALYGKTERIQIEEGFRQLLAEYGPGSVNRRDGEDDLAAETVRDAEVDEAAQHGTKAGRSAGTGQSQKARGRHKIG